MIKRLKWNVLYGGGDGVESDGGLSSSSSEDDRGEEEIIAQQTEANGILQQLFERDPDVAETLQAKMEALESSSDDEQEPERHMDKNQRKSNVLAANSPNEDKDESDENNQSEGEVEVEREAGYKEAEGGEQIDVIDNAGKKLEEEDQEYMEYRECELCPGKRLLSDEQVEAHLSSKRHLRAVARLEKQLAREKEREYTALNGKVSHEPIEGIDAEELNGGEKNGVVADGTSQEQIRKGTRRKAKAKRKLKALKRRKWEKLQAARMKNTTGENCGDNSDNKSETKPGRDSAQKSRETKDDEENGQDKPSARTRTDKTKRKKWTSALKTSAGEKQDDGHSGKTNEGDKKITARLAVPTKEEIKVTATCTTCEDGSTANKRSRDEAQPSPAQIAMKKGKKPKTKDDGKGTPKVGKKPTEGVIESSDGATVAINLPKSGRSRKKKRVV